MQTRASRSILPSGLLGTARSSQRQAFTLAVTLGALGSLAGLAGCSKSTNPPVSCGLPCSGTPTPALGYDVTTYGYDNARTGLNPAETVLTPSSVKAASFGKLALLATDGKVEAEPLYLSALTVNGASHNVLYVATEHDSVYAFDADTGAQLWKSSVLGALEQPSDDHGCNQITPEIGITATPVIDRSQGAHGVIYVVGMSKGVGGAYHQRLHALDVTTGAEIAGSPTEINAHFPGTGAASSGGVLTFDPGQYAERVGLLLLNGTIYLGWTSHCDQQPYTGWVMGYSESTLQQTSLINLTPNGSEGSVWMSGAGLAADSAGNVYLLDANGTLDTTLNAQSMPVRGDYGNAIVKLTTAGGALGVADYFEPSNTVAESNGDVDLGSGGALLLPDQTDANGSVRHLLVGAGKDGNIYVLDRDNLGKFDSSQNHIYQQLAGALPHGAWSKPAYFHGTVYYGGVGDTLKAYPLAGARLSTAPSSVSAATCGYPGATPSVSANGTGGGIVWALESGTGSAAVLHAYDAASLGAELYNSKQAAGSRDAFGNGGKFITPVVAHGRVYVPTPTGVAVFGLLQ